jgi:hypothetical protein
VRWCILADVNPRPRQVLVASALAFGTAAVAALAILLWSLTLSHLFVARDALIGQPGAGEEAVQAVDTIRLDLRFQLIVAGITLVVMVALGVALLRPLAWVRAAVWVSGLLLFLGWSCGLAQNVEVQTQRGSPAFPELQAAFRALLPGWYTGATGLLVGLIFVMFVALTIAVLRTEAAEYYQFGARKSGAPYTYLRPPTPDT